MTRIWEKIKKAFYGLGRWMIRYKGYHLWIAVILLLTLLFRLFSSNRRVMNAVAQYLTNPLKGALAAFCDLFPFSAAEASVILLLLVSVCYIIKAVRDIVKSPAKLQTFYRRLMGGVCAGLTVYFGFVLMWGVNYYTDTFQDKSGIRAENPSVEQLYETALYFASKTNEYASQVERNDNGVCAFDLDEVFLQSGDIYQELEADFPFLAGKTYQPKRVFFSELMSYANCTGFYFPWLAESNINVHCPKWSIPATIIHEKAHQKGVASEQEANLVAILGCTESEFVSYAYSGYLLGFIHLNNALFGADQDRWEQLWSTLSQEVRIDLADNSTYWDNYETPVAEAADYMTDQRLKNYGQELGSKSYGAVVDLLVVFYQDGYWE